MTQGSSFCFWISLLIFGVKLSCSYIGSWSLLSFLKNLLKIFPTLLWPLLFFFKVNVVPSTKSPSSSSNEVVFFLENFFLRESKLGVFLPGSGNWRFSFGGVCWKLFDPPKLLLFCTEYNPLGAILSFRITYKLVYYEAWFMLKCRICLSGVFKQGCPSAISDKLLYSNNFPPVNFRTIFLFIIADSTEALNICNISLAPLPFNNVFYHWWGFFSNQVWLYREALVN